MRSFMASQLARAALSEGLLLKTALTTESRDKMPGAAASVVCGAGSPNKLLAANNTDKQNDVLSFIVSGACCCCQGLMRA
jgi:hypothetical protein